MPEKKRSDEKEWSEIRDEILKKVVDFTDQQIEKVKASIHKKTEPKVDESHSDNSPSEKEKEMEAEGGRSVDSKIEGKKHHIKSA
ncbi:MAG: hypothetical protein ACO3A4_15265 [Silvanigrellaceae bacterium]